VSDIAHVHSNTALKIVAICQTVSFCNQTIFQASNNSEHNIESVRSGERSRSHFLVGVVKIS